MSIRMGPISLENGQLLALELDLPLVARASPLALEGRDSLCRYNPVALARLPSIPAGGGLEGE